VAPRTLPTATTTTVIASSTVVDTTSTTLAGATPASTGTLTEARGRFFFLRGRVRRSRAPSCLHATA
jgi:hypothetical protein